MARRSSRRAEQGGSLADYMESLERDRGARRSSCSPRATASRSPSRRRRSPSTSRTGSSASARLVEALERGERSRERLLDAAWADVPEPMRPAAAMAMQAHLEKLADEDRVELAELQD